MVDYSTTMAIPQLYSSKESVGKPSYFSDPASRVSTQIITFVKDIYKQVGTSKVF